MAVNFPCLSGLLRRRPVFILISLFVLCSCSKREKSVLVMSKTEGFRHSSIPDGIAALKKMGSENGFKVTVTEDSDYFVEDSLRNYSAVVFLNTTGDILNAEQQADLERYIQAGGGFVGIHAATDTEYDWPWYNKMVGAVFNGHPRIQEATLRVVDHDHAATRAMDSIWKKTDEYYNFRDIAPDITVLVTIDEASYEGGNNGPDHPISWYHDYDGGRAFYTELGHTEETYQNDLFLRHLLGGIKYAIGDNSRNYRLAKSDRVPPESRFIKEVLDFNLNEPMELDELPGKGILFIERRGALRLLDFKSEQTTTIAQLNVFYGNEDGLLGMALDPDYVNNHWIYLFYSAPGETSEQHISRFVLDDTGLHLDSEKRLLTIPTERFCCHSGGALEFGPDGNLFIFVGDNTNPFESDGFAPIDERDGRQIWDAQRSAGNSNDLRGNILRIKPEPDGSYSIPKGNLFPPGTPDTRPEIYVKGCRNPFRGDIDTRTGYLYWGDVGPDAGKADPERGPSGMGEFDQARKAGYFGWPYTRGFNEAYNDFDFTTQTSGPKFDPDNLVNDSPHNTGIQNLPPAQRSMIPMTYYRSEQFPWMGEGGINPMAGPVFHAADQPNAKFPFPDYFENKLFLYEWIRDWIYVITLDEDQNFVKADPFMPNTEFSHPMDMIFGSDGRLYLLEYGQSWNTQNLDARLSRITYLPGNRIPVPRLTMDKTVGSAPLTVRFSAKGSQDYDHDALSYAWTFTGDDIQATEMEPEFTFTENGIYKISLTVSDNQGHTASTTSQILVGNDPPELTLTIKPMDSMYFNGKEVTYKVNVSDPQDGSTANDGIAPEKVKVTFEYVPEGKDLVTATLGHLRNLEPEGKKLIEDADCKACHALDKTVNGPSYNQIANKYPDSDIGYLVSKIIKGGGGVWGERAMAAHPQLTVEETTKMVEYILSLKPSKTPPPKSLPLEGKLRFNKHPKQGEEGVYVLAASYKDLGAGNIPGSELTASKQIVFRPEKWEAEAADAVSEQIDSWNADGAKIVGEFTDGTFLRFNKRRLKGLKSLKIAAYYYEDDRYVGRMEVRENALDGPMIGSLDIDYQGDRKAIYYRIPIRPTATEADLFFVFRFPDNPKADISNIDWIIPEYE